MYDAVQEQQETMRHTCSTLDTFEPQQLFKFKTKKNCCCFTQSRIIQSQMFSNLLNKEVVNFSGMGHWQLKKEIGYFAKHY